jgi:hypothetical protein
MATDASFLDQLADNEVPAAPADFQQQLHGRLNDWLLIVQLGDLLVGAFPYAIRLFAHALGGLVRLTLTGEYPPRERERDTGTEDS